MTAMKTLREICDVITDGTHYTPKDIGVGFPFLTVKDMSDAGLDFIGCSRISESDYNATVNAGCAPRIGDVLFSKDGTVGKVHVVTESQPFGVLSSIAILRPKQSVLDPAYLEAALAMPKVLDQALKRKTGSAIRRIILSDLKEVRIPLPPLPEQHRIAAILDQAEALRTKRRAALTKLDTLAQSIFMEMFGDPATNPKQWPSKPVGDLASKFSDGPFGSNLKSEHYTESGVRVIRLQNIGVGELSNEDLAFISETHFASLRKHECRPGDVLIGTLGDPNLRACVQPPSLSVALNKADCVQLRPNLKIAEASYLCALLNHPSTGRMAQSLILGQTRGRISMGRLRGLKVPVPPLSLQVEFSKRIKTLRGVKDHHDRSLTQLDDLFASIQLRAVRGEL